ncbi:MAG TPA: HAMP domain-containing sensor histidine kinase [Hydrogenophaga sp.]|uniref:sensor histidine kinase n=1 Tax=Hydrogenophaga sp. TaxID=1904254 RepID=UPI002CFA7901|nr:HAMP domain-containing sensor histidine kinase [Hydrogenophaga sp.]HMN93554.1 HAMP domain-containing sensor histidine kinase [Hydrogenophaga sp.]HMP10269.1 HAMP domain-containing sensor histidine kinase [Hydrogenophaga sp.]
MLVDTQPATHQHIPASPEVREQWVNAQLIGVVMDGAMTSLLASCMALPALVFVLLGEVDTYLLLGWMALMVFMLLHRYRVITIYRMRYDSVGGSTRQDFMQRYSWSWVLAAAAWGVPIGLAFLRADIYVQFVCALVVLAQGLISIITLSAWFPLFRMANAAVLLTVTGGIGLQIALRGLDQQTLETMAILVALLLIYWWLLLVGGRRLHATQHSNLELQFSNQELIDSLTLQTRASLRAVATKNRFLASAAHDLRQPVHALSLYADWLATEPEMARDIAPRILQSTRAINELFDSLFDLTRIDAGNYKVKLQNVSVQALLADVVLQFAPVAAAKSLRLRSRAPDVTIWADPVVLRRILGNLVSNALKHTQKGGVLLGLRVRRDMVVFEVWDTGVGIPREHQQAIFQEFFRVSQHQGTEDSLGLGLTIVSKLATLMGYQLALNSQAGRGSVFRVMVPAFTQPAALRDLGRPRPLPKTS